MKKKILLAMFLLLTSCQEATSTSQSGPVISNNEEVSNSNISVATIFDSKWGPQYNDLIIGNLGVDIPYIEVNNFIVDVSMDNFGDPMVEIYCEFAEDEIATKLDEYSLICQNEGFIVNYQKVRDFDETGYGIIEYDLYVADKIINETQGLEIMFLEGNLNGKEMMGIFAYTYPYDDPYQWPSNLVIYLIGHDVPHLEDTGNYQYDAQVNADEYGRYIDMIITGIDAEAEQEYYDLLIENDYVIDDSDYDEYGYYAFDPTLTFVIQFKLTEYGLEIYIFEI